MKWLTLILLLVAGQATALCEHVYSVAWIHPFRSMTGGVRLLVETATSTPLQGQEIIFAHRQREDHRLLVLRTENGRDYLLKESTEPGKAKYELTDPWGQVTPIPHEVFEKEIKPHLPEEELRHDYKSVVDLQHRARQREIDVAAIKDSLKFAPKLLFYPYAIPYKILRHWITEKKFMGMPLLAAVGHTIRRDGVLAVGYLLMVYNGVHPALLFVAVSYYDDDQEREKYAITLRSFMDVTQHRAKTDGEGEILFIDGVSPGDPVDGAPRKLFDDRLQHEKRARYVKVSGAAEAVQAIRRASEGGKKVDAMDVISHGDTVPGLNALQLGSDFVTTEPAKFSRGLARAIAAYDKHKKETGETDPRMEQLRQMKVVDLNQFPDLRQYFSRGASVRLISCDLTSGVYGEFFMEALGRKTVAGEGGVVIGSTKTIAAEPSDFPPDVRIRKVVDAIEKRREEENEAGKTEPKPPENGFSLADHALLHAMLPYLFVTYGEKLLDREPVVVEPPIKIMKTPKR